MLVNYPHSSLLCLDVDAFDVVARLAQGFQLRVEDVGGFDGGLRVELCRIRDLEQDVLHNVGRVRLLELELLALFTVYYLPVLSLIHNEALP